MRPIAGPKDENRALELFCVAIYDDPDAFAEFVPKGSTPKPVAIAEDGSAAEIDLFQGLDDRRVAAAPHCRARRA